ncbi:hypothetical protein SAMN05443544_1936 [Agromyces cerinus subsp. cerinus]|uniref:Uncharacterized protein n=1 Tax=Agromyces cerinus subsp. cerinus TaxID=232089 RepID=A0A1N6FCQ0_9MICO|nr:hypothetical protein SAMN05443544_1936 [Agromyces cerinus subsp. cerinus]
MLEAATVTFVEEATALAPEALAEAFGRLVALRREGGKEASRAAVPSAAENSELDHEIRSALLPRAAELDAVHMGLHSDARAAISTTARAILKRGKLTPEQYRVLVEPFVGSGVEIPRHPSQDAEN